MDLKKVKADAQTPAADISACVDKWRFLVRPEEGIGEGTLHYASLSAVLSALSGEGGGCDCELEQVLTSGTKIARWTPDGQNWTDIYCTTGGGCSCDLSVTPPATLTSLGQDLVQIADWTKDNWQTHVPILAPDTMASVNEINLWQDMTPFSLTLTENSIAQGRIEHCFFYYGRELKVVGSGTYYLNGAGTYYLHIATDQYGHY